MICNPDVTTVKGRRQSNSKRHNSRQLFNVINDITTLTDVCDMPSQCYADARILCHIDCMNRTFTSCIFEHLAIRKKIPFRTARGEIRRSNWRPMFSYQTVCPLTQAVDIPFSWYRCLPENRLFHLSSLPRM